MSLLIIYFLATVLISAACSVFEATLFSATTPFVEASAKLTKTGKILKHLKANIDNSVGAVLVINMFANTIGAAAVGAQSVEVFGEEWAGVVAIIMTLSILYVAEIIPKTLAALYWKKLILPCCYPLIVMYYIAFPFVYISRGITFFFRKGNVEKISRDEILALMELGEKSGSLDALEMDILEHIIGQKSIKVKDIMTPVNLVYSLDENLSLKDALKETQKRKYSRIPISTQGEIIPKDYPTKEQKDSKKSQEISQSTNKNLNYCLVYRKEILQANLKDKGDQPIKSIAKEFHTVKENMQVLMLLRLFILRHKHLFAVLDKNKNLVGVVSLEDTINAVLGVGNLARH